MTPKTETDPKVLLKRIDEAAKQGYAVVQNQVVMGDISVAAAITDHRGQPFGAVIISVPSTRWTIDQARDQLVPHVQVAATAHGCDISARAEIACRCETNRQQKQRSLTRWACVTSGSRPFSSVCCQEGESSALGRERPKSTYPAIAPRDPQPAPIARPVPPRGTPCEATTGSASGDSSGRSSHTCRRQIASCAPPYGRKPLGW